MRRQHTGEGLDAEDRIEQVGRRTDRVRTIRVERRGRERQLRWRRRQENCARRDWYRKCHSREWCEPGQARLFNGATIVADGHRRSAAAGHRGTAGRRGRLRVDAGREARGRRHDGQHKRQGACHTSRTARQLSDHDRHRSSLDWRAMSNAPRHCAPRHCAAPEIFRLRLPPSPDRRRTGRSLGEFEEPGRTVRAMT
jgi:hypothetical protein